MTGFFGGGAGGGSGTVTSVSSADSSIVVSTPNTTPSLKVATLDVLAANEPPAAAVAMNGKKITGLANGTAATDALAVGQVLAANVIPVADLVAGLAGQVLGGTGPAYAYPPGYEIGYDQITAPVTVTSTTESAGTVIISSSAYTFDGGAVICEFFAPYFYCVDTAGDNLNVSLFEGATQIGRIAYNQAPLTGTNIAVPCIGKLRFTPSAGSHTYTVTAFGTASGGVIGAGVGGTGHYVAAYTRFTKV